MSVRDGVIATVCGFLLFWADVCSAGSPLISGVTTALEGPAFVARTGESRPLLLQPYSMLVRGDAIETGPQSRLKALFQEQFLVALGPGSRLEVQAEQDTDLVLHLTRGTARILIDEPAALAQPRLQIHTVTATIFANSPFVLEIRDAETGEPSESPPTTFVAHIGTAGSLQVTGQGETVTVGSGQSTLVVAGQAPSQAHFVKVATRSDVRRVLQQTTIPDQRSSEGARQMLLASGGTEPFTRGPVTGRRPDQAVARPTSPPLMPPTPPAVISGAVSVNGTNQATGQSTPALPASPPVPVRSSPPVSPAPLPGVTPTPTTPPPAPAPPTPVVAPPPAPTPPPAPAPVVVPLPAPLPDVKVDIPKIKLPNIRD